MPEKVPFHASKTLSLWAQDDHFSHRPGEHIILFFTFKVTVTERKKVGVTNPRLLLISVLNWTQAYLLAVIIFSTLFWLAVICGHGSYSFNIHFQWWILTFSGNLMKNSSPMLSLHHYSIIPKPLNNHNQAARNLGSQISNTDKLSGPWFVSTCEGFHTEQSAWSETNASEFITMSVYC